VPVRPGANPFPGAGKRRGLWSSPLFLGAGFAGLAGLVFGLSATHWLIGVTFWGWLLLSLYLALWWALFGLLLAFVRSRFCLPLSATAATLWVALEFLRASVFTGCPILMIGHAFAYDPVLIQIADFSGVYGPSFFILFLNGVMAEMYLGLRMPVPTVREMLFHPQLAAARVGARLYRYSPWISALLALLLLGATGAYGVASIRISTEIDARAPRLRLVLVQPNHRTRDRAALEKKEAIRAFDEKTFQRCMKLSREGLSRPAPAGSEATTEGYPLVIWPESAVPGSLWEGGAETDRYGDIAEFCREEKIYLLLGTSVRGRPRRSGGDGAPGAAEEGEGEQPLFNSAVLFSPEGRDISRYDKVRLVPFGEYIPLEPVLGFLARLRPIVQEENFSAGPRGSLPIEVPEPRWSFPPAAGTSGGTSEEKEGSAPRSPPTGPARLGMSICYEDLFAFPLREATVRGADVLVNLSNDGWFSGTAEPALHSCEARFRAIENRRPLVRVGSVGVTEVVERSGRVSPGREVRVDGKNTGVAGVISLDVPFRFAGELSFYARRGDFFAATCLGASLLMLLVAALTSARALRTSRTAEKKP